MTRPLVQRAEGALGFPFGKAKSDAPAPGATMQVAPGVHWLRMPLPFALDHINLWLLEDGPADDPGWTIVDTGIQRDDTKELWRRLFRGAMAGRRVRRLIVTHFHPDHMGLAGWLVDELGAELWATRTEWLTARMLHMDAEATANRAMVGFFRSHGVDRAWLDGLAARGNTYRRRVGLPPASFTRIEDGDELRIGGNAWRVIVGTGHAPEHACLHCPALGVLISGDQILPKITPNISVWGGEPDANPLAQYIGSLGRFRGLPAETLVLPSHNAPFVGLEARLDELDAHHDQRLDQVVAAIADGGGAAGGAGEARTAAELIPVLFRRQLDEHQMGFAAGESVAHLTYLVNTGRLVRTTGTDGVHRYRLPPGGRPARR